MNKKDEKQNKILLEAFKLFLTKEYDDVITSDIEKVTGLTRGAIYYDVKTKEGLYKAVIDKFVFGIMDEAINRDISVSDKTPFWDFVTDELRCIQNRMTRIRDYGINANSSEYISLLASANFHYIGFKEKCYAFEQELVGLWTSYYKKGVDVGEIAQDFDQKVIILMFRSLYYGDSFGQSIIGGGLEIEELKEKYTLLYKAIQR